jgi:hypothetical protein
LVSLFVSNTRYNSVAQFPFQALGFFALMILFLMAATSHDFWLRNLTAPTWKRLHMMVYVAYGLADRPRCARALQSERSPFLAAALGVGTCHGIEPASVGRLKERGIDAGKTVEKSGHRRWFCRSVQSRINPEKWPRWCRFQASVSLSSSTT